MTGDASDSPINAAIRRAGMPVLRKPLTIDDVIEGLRSVLETADSDADRFPACHPPLS
jgi:hypothetical protein